MRYKGYVGKAEFDDEAAIFYGEVENLRDVITFQAESIEGLRTAFQDSVDDHKCKIRSSNGQEIN